MKPSEKRDLIATNNCLKASMKRSRQQNEKLQFKYNNAIRRLKSVYKQIGRIIENPYQQSKGYRGGK